MKKLNSRSRWKCKKCGFEADGQTWNTYWVKDFGLWGALYNCPHCGQHVELKEV